MDEAMATLLTMIRDALKELPGREVAGVRTACLVASVQEDGREACEWLTAFLAVGTGPTVAEEAAGPVPAQAGAGA